jgi:hypothetical protein
MYFSAYRQRVPAENTPIFISFFAGAEYYRTAADSLANKLEAFGAGYYICELKADRPLAWPDICKQKIHFIAHALDTLDRSVFWIDVDTEVHADPSRLLRIDGADFGAYLRNFQYLPNFNPLAFSRLFHPGYVLYANTPATRRFVEGMAAIAERMTEPVTDDYVLHQALFEEGHALSIHLLSPATVAKRADEATGETVFVHGDSGNVDVYRSQVVQHGARKVEGELKATVLSGFAADLMGAKKYEEAAVLNGLAHVSAPLNVAVFVRELKLMRRLNRTDRLEDLLAHGKSVPELRQQTYLFDFERLAKARKFREAEALLEEAFALEIPELTALLRSRQYVFWLDKRAAETGANPQRRTRLWWWQRPYPGNWGDIINPYVVEKLTGLPPRFTSEGPRLYAIGSVIGWADDEATVWGSGSPKKTVTLNPKAKYLAVRGPLTRQLLLDAGIDCPEVYGDPALLLPRLYTPKPRPAGDGRPVLGLILHHNHDVGSLEVGPGVKVIDIHRIGYDEIEAFIDEVAACDAVVSSSLHGLIVSHAYGIPTRWADVVGGGAVPGDGMKFVDYFQSVGIHDVTEPLVLAPGSRVDLDDLLPLCTERPDPARIAALQDGLIASAPFPLAGAGGPAAGAVVPLRSPGRPAQEKPKKPRKPWWRFG